MLIVMMGVVIIVFSLSRAAGDPRLVYLSPFTTPEQWDEWGREMGLHRPVVVQFLVWFSKIARGDLGDSLLEARPVTKMMLERLPASLQLGGAAWVFAMLLGWPLGVLSAVKRGTIWDYVGRFFALFGQALPAFWVGIMLIFIFAVQLEWLPVGRRGGITHYILPVVTIGWGAAAALLRLVRSAMLEVMREEYVKVARSKGLRESVVVWRHVVRNASIPPLTLMGLLIASYITGTLVVEIVFAWPGIGRLAIDAVEGNDFPLITGTVLLGTAIYLVFNFLVDVIYVYVDPRVRVY